AHDLLGRMGVAAAQCEHELVAADAPAEVSRAEVGREPLRDGGEHRVAVLVPARVVQVAEAVDVDRDDRDRPALTPRSAQLHLEGVLERAVVEDTGERVAKRERLELALGLRELLRDLVPTAPVVRAAAEYQPESQGSRDG